MDLRTLCEFIQVLSHQVQDQTAILYCRKRYKESRVSKAVFAFSTDKEMVQYFTEDDGTGVNKELFTCHSVESSFECSRKDQQKPP